MVDGASDKRHFLVDREVDCYLCGAPIRAGQAARLVDGAQVHGRCARDNPRS
jgi:hypothetical protein